MADHLVSSAVCANAAHMCQIIAMIAEPSCIMYFNVGVLCMCVCVCAAIFEYVDYVLSLILYIHTCSVEFVV